MFVPFASSIFAFLHCPKKLITLPPINGLFMKLLIGSFCFRSIIVLGTADMYFCIHRTSQDLVLEYDRVLLSGSSASCNIYEQA
ncbi:hypothetical protein RJT34_15673 [Clitoria ternatea]|uniref:Uncharacterized protein n=1 Tax=Clitoria ternatea TaxID=43366 RepID=A0AAN9PD00_CLITE